MSLLKDALAAALGGDAQFREEYQFPETVAFCTVPKEKFAEAARAMKKAYAFLAAEWANEETPWFGIFACYRWGNEYVVVKTVTTMDDPAFPSLTKKYLPAYRFERQMNSLMGVVPEGHPDVRPWIKFEDWPRDAWPLRKAFDGSRPLPRIKGEYRWSRAEGEGVYEIPVGPVHAGIIEPGHFRFQAVGEQILNLEERLGYVHKGIEKRFESLKWGEGHRLAGRVSGDTTVAHSLAYCMALESMTGCTPPERALWLRALFLERERIVNHIGDIGAVCNDAAFAFMLYQMMRLKEILLRTHHELFGHRFLMDKVIPGGVSADIDQGGREKIVKELSWLGDEFERLITIYDDNSSLEDRVRDTGVLPPEKARELGAVGIVARASGLNVDCRVHHPFPPYDRIGVNVPVLISGDVHARVWVRVEEVRESIRLIREILRTLPEGEISRPVADPAPERAGFAAVEGWRGEILYWVQSGPEGQINRCMVRDPSSLNWLGLEQAIPGNIVPDFPLCNKSFNQSYSGHDL
ncbi:MAG: NADH-quinone oxidoreductase subunit C [Alphaproteobacteria bacterium]|uniref:NADH-quinone oxidoreductase subunit C n=1 Tax=Candidatus Nitrobium versatile TaxID=2884831 RepID=A0A953LX34_9BACT|nr:NADH-quinone oxidoreductase subunit C [Candidatus Nitrobium versatile]